MKRKIICVILLCLIVFSSAMTSYAMVSDELLNGVESKEKLDADDGIVKNEENTSFSENELQVDEIIEDEKNEIEEDNENVINQDSIESENTVSSYSTEIKDGLIEIDNDWKMVVNGKIDYNYTGMGANRNGKWYVENGTITYKYTGVIEENGIVYVIENSFAKEAFSKEEKRLVELRKNDWKMVVDGKIDENYTGVGANRNGKWYIENGDITYKYTNVAAEDDTVYVIENSHVKETFSKKERRLVELRKNDWKMVVDGKIDEHYTGVGANRNGKWYIENGDITYKYTNVAAEDDTVYVIENSHVKETFSKKERRLVELRKNDWKMVVDGKIDEHYTGVGANRNGKWYIENGDITYKYTNVAAENDTVYVIENSHVKETFSKEERRLVELRKNDWKMVVDGKIEEHYTGTGININGRWYIEDGQITYHYNGLAKDDTGIYVVHNSYVDNITKMMEFDGEWYMIVNGKADEKYTGLAENKNGKWLFENGKISYEYTDTWFDGEVGYIIENNKVYITVDKNTNGMFEVNKEWRNVVNGKVDYNYTGVAQNAAGRWYFEDGKLTYTYNGEYTDTDGITYIISNSRFSGVLKVPGYSGNMIVEYPIQSNGYISDSLCVSGWVLSSEKNDKVLIYVDGKYIGEATREKRSELFDEPANNEYGGIDTTPLPGFYYNLGDKGLKLGYHKITVKNVASDGETVIQSREVEIDITALTKSFGIDVSHYQGEIDWDAVKKSGVTFALLKIGEYWSSSKKVIFDQFFERNYWACKRLGIAVGGYFYSYAFNRAEGIEEADVCLSLIKNKRFELPIFIDVEDKAIKNAVANGKTDKANVTDASLAFCEKMVNAGHQAGVYASRNFFYDYFDIPLLEKYWIWVAHYTSSQTDYTGKYNFWQYTSDGNVNGINGRVDLDWFYQR